MYYCNNLRVAWCEGVYRSSPKTKRGSSPYVPDAPLQNGSNVAKEKHASAEAL